MNSEKVKEIKKALGNCQKDNCLDCPYFIDEKRCRANDLLLDAINLINELESENEILKINMHETENLSFQINQMNGNLILENQKLKDRLAELEDKIENGTLKELPCKVGSRVYAVNHSKYNISGGYVSEEFVNKIHISSHTILVETTENGIWISKSYLPQDFGDIVFTTKAEAEAKLKELQEKQE